MAAVPGSPVSPLGLSLLHALCQFREGSLDCLVDIGPGLLGVVVSGFPVPGLEGFLGGGTSLLGLFEEYLRFGVTLGFEPLEQLSAPWERLFLGAYDCRGGVFSRYVGVFTA